MTLEQKLVYENLKDNCGGTCLTDPENCECFGIPPQDILDEIGETAEEYNCFYCAEECPHYDAMSYSTRNVIEQIDEENKIIAQGMCRSLTKGKELKDGCTEEEIVEEIKKHLNNGIDMVTLGMQLLFNSHKFLKGGTIKNRKEYVYILHSDHGYKIGRSYEPQIRSRTIGTKTPFDILKTEIFEVKDMSKAECGLHRHFKKYRLNGEWFDLNESQLQEARDIIDKQYSEIKDTLKPLFEVKEIG